MSSTDAIRTQDIKHGGITKGRINGDVVIKRLDTVQLGVRVVCVPLYAPALPFQIKLMFNSLTTTSTFILLIVYFNPGRNRIMELLEWGTSRTVTHTASEDCIKVDIRNMQMEQM
jgi:hypothetical protein